MLLAGHSSQRAPSPFTVSQGVQPVTTGGDQQPALVLDAGVARGAGGGAGGRGGGGGGGGASGYRCTDANAFSQEGCHLEIKRLYLVD